MFRLNTVAGVQSSVLGTHPHIESVQTSDQSSDGRKGKRQVKPQQCL